MGFFLIVLACIGILLAVAIRCKAEWLLNMVMRSVLGTIAIYFINMIIGFLGISMNVGINPVTVLTCGILGIPGLLVLYGIGFYQLL